MFPDTYCTLCNGKTSTGCAFCNPNFHGLTTVYDELHNESHDELIKKINELSRKLGKYEDKYGPL